MRYFVLVKAEIIYWRFRQFILIFLKTIAIIKGYGK